MSLLTANNLTKFYGPDEVFSDISVEVPQRSRIALVGPNGAGKTTLINLLAGLDVPTSGTLNIAKSARVSFLPQRPEMAGGHSLWEEQLTAFTALREMEDRLHELAHDLADPERHDAALAEYGALQAEFERLGGYHYPARIRMVLSGVGFDESDDDTPLTHLSGGQKTRALLARLLLEAPELLILDEPTNHLDIGAVEWLESFLRDYPGAVLSVSHDRYFIDNFADTVWEMEFRRLETYRGNYTHYLQQREERRERLQKEYDAQQAFIAKEKAYIRKHMGSRWTSQAKGRQKKLDTLRKRGAILDAGPQNHKSMNISISAEARSGDKVIMTRELQVGYDAPLFAVPDLELWRGETAAIIGPNGAGKTTLLKTLIGELDPLSGSVRLGASVQVGYFAQAHEKLNPKSSIIDQIMSVSPMPISEARHYLGRFMFSVDDVFRPIGTLSGGERGRVALATLALSGANLLLLDEPTNHLDIDSQEILQTVLADFEGTILLVSHDRYLIDALATRIWSIAPGELAVFDGSYADYVTARNQRLALEAAASSQNGRANGRKKAAQYAEKKHGLSPYELQKRIEALETAIHQLEGELEALTAEIEAASASGDTERVMTLGAQYTELESHLETQMDEWMKLAE